MRERFTIDPGNDDGLVSFFGGGGVFGRKNSVDKGEVGFMHVIPYSLRYKGRTKIHRLDK